MTARAGLIKGGIAALALATLGGGAALPQNPPAPGAHDRFRWPLRGPIVQDFNSGDHRRHRYRGAGRRSGARRR